jgi:hypothetical protein
MTTVPASGVVSLSNLQAAFGGPSTEISLSSYYASTAQGLWTTGVPTTGRISLNNFRGKFQGGSQIFTTVGANSWTVPANITSIDIVCVGGGGGSSYANLNAHTAGGGGALAYVNNISVTPGEVLTVNVGAAGSNAPQVNNSTGASGGLSSVIQNSIIIIQANGGDRGGLFTANPTTGNTLTFAGGTGGTVGVGTGGAGGNGGAALKATSVNVNGVWTNGAYGGAGGAGGYSGSGGAGGAADRRMVGVGTAATATGGNGSNGSGGGGGGGGGNAMVTTISTTTPVVFTDYPTGLISCRGGGTGLYGQGSSGTGGAGRTVVYDGTTANTGTAPVIGGNGSVVGSVYGGGGVFNQAPMQGAVRIVWPGTTRAFPSTLVSTQ